MDRPEILRKKYTTIFFMGVAMISSLFIYWVLIQFVIQPRQALESTVALKRYMIYFVALTDLVIIILLKKNLSQKKPQDNLTALVNKLQTSAMTIFVLCESPAILGFAFYFIGGSRQDYYILATYSLSLFAIFFPRLNQWEEYTAGAVV